jgi:hypothetical protein
MGDLVYVPDHKARAVASLLSQHQRKPRIRSLVESLAEGAQSTEDEGFDVLISTTLSAAQGANLDQWGALVGEVRGDLADEDYRVFITARIRVNNSTGTTDEIIAIWSIVVAPFLEIRQRTIPPATFSLDTLRDTPMNDARAGRVGAMMRDVKPAGIAMMLIESTPGYFGFAEDPESLPWDVGQFSRAL